MTDRKKYGAIAGTKDRLLTAKQVAGRLGVTAPTVWRLVGQKILPTPIRFNRKLVRWLERDIEDGFEAQRQGR